MGAATRRELPRTSLQHRRSPLASVDSQQELLASVPLATEFDAALAAADRPPLAATGLDVLQLNLGRLCNQACAHCHVDAGPDRREVMDEATAELALDVLARTDIPTVDITGGAPEMAPVFRRLVTGARELGRHVMDRCNLTILTAPGYEGLADFLAEHRVEVVCSLPHHRALSTDRQRGDGVYAKSIEALERLNALGYGRTDGDLRLVVVTNPVGAFLPAGQASLEAEWRRELEANHGVHFDALYTITNMPISRYLEWLEQTGNLEGYLTRLVEAFNPVAADAVMCRTMLSVDWKGYLHDCDFNQMLELGLTPGAPAHLSEFDAEALATRRIVTGRHCFGCTAGAGSSCGGEVAS